MTLYYPGIWFYNPSIAAAVIFGLFFLAITVIHTYQLVRTRTWHWIPFVLGGYCETAGYITRAVGASQIPAFTLAPYIVNAVLILVAPALFAASMYMDLRKIVRLTEGEKLLPMSAKLLTPVFVFGDLICFFLQFAGKSLDRSHTLCVQANKSRCRSACRPDRCVNQPWQPYHHYRSCATDRRPDPLHHRVGHL